MEDHSDIGSDSGNVGADSSEPRFLEAENQRITTLSESDKEAVDRLFQYGFDQENTSNLDDREVAVLQVLANLEQYPAESSTDELVDATLAGIDQFEARREARYSMASDNRTTIRSIHVPEFFATAAALFLAVGIGVPLFQSIQANERISTSQHRLGTVGAAIAGFSLDHGGALPLSESDDQRGTPLHQQIYSQNLAGLVEGERCGFSSLFAGDESQPRPMVSYRVFVTRKTFNTANFRSDDILLGDPNPVLESFRARERHAHPMSGAITHDGEGLVVYRFDGSTPFIVQPVDFDERPNADSTSQRHMDLIWVSDGYRHGDQDGIGWPQVDSDVVLAD